MEASSPVVVSFLEEEVSACVEKVCEALSVAVQTRAVEASAALGIH